MNRHHAPRAGPVADAWRPNVGVLDSLRFGDSPWTKFTFNPDLMAQVTRFSSTDSISRGFAEGDGPTEVRSPAIWENYGYDAQARLNLARPGAGGARLRTTAWGT